MDDLTEYRDKMTDCAYFDGLEFVSYNRSPRCKAWVDATFAFYAINLAWGGYLYYRLDDGDPIKLTAPAIWWTLPGRRYRYGCHDNVAWDQRWIAFKGPRADRFVELGLLPDIDPPIARPKDPAGFLDAFDGLLRYLFSPDCHHTRAVHALEGLLSRVGTPDAFPAPSGASQWAPLEELAARIRERPETAWDFHKEARRLGMSYSRFRQAFKEMAHKAPLAYAIECRLNKAAGFLREQELSIAETAYRSGFEDAYYFSRAFRRRFGVSPRTYRARFEYPRIARSD